MGRISTKANDGINVFADFFNEDKYKNLPLYSNEKQKAKYEKR